MRLPNKQTAVGKNFQNIFGLYKPTVFPKTERKERPTAVKSRLKMSVSVSIEPSFAVAAATIAASSELSGPVRREWCSALRCLARHFQQPMETIPARYSAVRARMAALHPVPAGCAPKTLANTRSNAKAALLWFRKEEGLLADGVALTPAWQTLYQQLRDPSTRYRLAPVMRYCAELNIGPEETNDAILEQFLAHRERTSSRTADAAARRIIARLWNGCAHSIPGWPDRHAAGALLLKHRPGEYELVRCLLGHKSVETTKKFYLDLETTMASDIYTDIVRQKVVGSEVTVRRSWRWQTHGRRWRRIRWSLRFAHRATMRSNWRLLRCQRWSCRCQRFPRPNGA